MKMAARRLHTFSTGYTLIEMLVALTLLGFIVVLISGTFQFGARAWEATAREIDRAGEIEAGQSFLRRELAQTLQLSFGMAAAEPEPVFAGGSESLRFSAPLSFRYLDGGLYVFTLGVGSSGSTDDLVLQWRVYRPDASPREEPVGEPTTLVSDIADLRLAYYGRISDDADPAWHPQWDGEDLPDLVRVDVAFPDAGRRVWPSLIVALKSSSGVRR